MPVRGYTPRIGDKVIDGTSGSVLFIDSNGKLAQDNANLFWDDTNNRLGIGTATPNEKLNVIGNYQLDDASTPTKSYRFRTTGSALDFDGAGQPIYVSVYDNADYTGNQAIYQIYGHQYNYVTCFLNWEWKDSSSAIQASINPNVGFVFNEGGETDLDFRVEGSGQANALFVDATQGNVGIGTATPAETLHVVGRSLFIEGTGDVLIGELDGVSGFGAIGLNGDLSTSNYTFTSTGSDLFTNRPTGGNMYFSENNVAQMTLAPGGNFGLGITPLSRLHLPDDTDIGFGAIPDALMGFNSGNNSLDIDLTGGINATARILTDSSGIFEIAKSGTMLQTVSNHSSNVGVNYFYGGNFLATRSGSQSPTNQVGIGWNFQLNEENNTATRGTGVVGSNLIYTGDGAGVGDPYVLSNFTTNTTFNPGASGSIDGSRVATFQTIFRHDGAITTGGNIESLLVIATMGGPFVGSFTAENMFGINMRSSFGNGSGTLTVNDTYANFAATEIALQPANANPIFNFPNATNVFIERMIAGTQRSAFHMATSGTTPGGDLLFGKQGNARILVADGGDLLIDPANNVNGVLTATINNGGTGYLVKGFQNIVQSGNTTARVEITSVSSGVVTGIRLVDIGKDYSVGTGLSTEQSGNLQGGNSDLTVDITVNPNPGVLINSDSRLLFGDSGTYINQGADGHLDLTADVSIDLNGVVEMTDDAYFVGAGSGFPFGNMWNHDTTTAVTIVTSGVAVRIPSGFTTGYTNLTTFQNSREIVVTKTGKYKAVWNISFTAGAANQEVEGVIMVNNAEVATTKGGSAHRRINTGTDTGNMGAMTILDLSANDVVSLGVINETSTNTISVEHANLVLEMIGG